MTSHARLGATRDEHIWRPKGINLTSSPCPLPLSAGGEGKGVVGVQR